MKGFIRVSHLPPTEIVSRDLSFAALGVYTILCTCSPATVQDISNHSSLDSEETILEAIEQLEDCELVETIEILKTFNIAEVETIDTEVVEEVTP